MRLSITLFVYALSISTLFGQWVTDNMSTGRHTLTSASYQGKIYIISGTNNANSIAHNTVDVIDPVTTTLDTTITMPKGVGYAQAIAGDSALYVAGGFRPSFNGVYSGTKYFQAYKNGTWTIDSTLASAVMSPGVIKVGSKIIIAGGLKQISWNSSHVAETIFTDSVSIYDESTGQWSFTTLSQPRGYIAVATDGNIAMFAGGISGLNQTSKVIDIYNASTNTWSVDSLSTARGWASGAYVNGEFLFAGGVRGGTQHSTTIDIYDGSAWSIKYLSSARYCVQSVVVGDNIVFTGGGTMNLVNYNWLSVSDRVEIYNKATGITSATILNVPRIVHTASAMGNTIVVAGGWNNGSELYTYESWKVAIGIPEQDNSRESLRVYPNPSNGSFTIRLPDIAFKGSLELYSISGQLVYQQKVDYANELELNLELEAGVYVMRLYSPNQNLTQRLILQ